VKLGRNVCLDNPRDFIETKEFFTSKSGVVAFFWGGIFLKV
jgi:hypothetical protein